MPLPFTMRRKVFTYVPLVSLVRGAWTWQLTTPTPSFISENPIVAKVQYWLKITFVFILVLFIDSVNRVYRVQLELAAVSDSNGGSHVYVPPPFPLHTPRKHTAQNKNWQHTPKI